jgi:hypothetical protein
MCFELCNNLSGSLICAQVRQAAQQDYADINTKEKSKDNRKQEGTAASEKKCVKSK